MLLLAVLSPGEARAEAKPEERTAFLMSAAAGVGLPLGEAYAGKPLADWLSVAFPLTFELGTRILGRYELAVTGTYSLGVARSTGASGCYNASNGCSASVGQVGLAFLWHPLGLTAVDPYLGVGVGYEWLEIRATVQGKNFDQSFGGWNVTMLQGGVDFSLGGAFTVGPYVQASLGEYLTSSYTVPTQGGGVQSGSSSVANPAVHFWLAVGVRLVVIP